MSETALDICSTSSSCSSSCGSTVGLSKKGREWSARSYSSYCGYSPFQRNLRGPLSSATTSARRSQTGYLVRVLSHLVPLRHVNYVLFERPSLICLSVGFLSLILNLAALPPSPTRLSPTQAPLVAPMLPMAGLIMHQHVPIALFRSHLPTLADTMLRFSHCISTYSNGALNPPRIVASTTYSRGNVSVAGVGVETVVPPLPTPPAVYSIICLRQTTEKVRSPSTHGARTHASDSQLNINSSPNHFHQHHCECCCDFHPSGVTRLLLWPRSCSSSCSHHNSALTTNRHPPVRYLTIDRSMGMK